MIFLPTKESSSVRFNEDFSMKLVPFLFILQAVSRNFFLVSKVKDSCNGFLTLNGSFTRSYHWSWSIYNSKEEKSPRTSQSTIQSYSKSPTGRSKNDLFYEYQKPSINKRSFLCFLNSLSENTVNFYLNSINNSTNRRIRKFRQRMRS